MVLHDENLFEHLSLGKAFNRTYRVFMDRLDVFMIISALVLGPTLALTTTAALIFVQSTYGGIGGLYGANLSVFVVRHHRAIVASVFIEAIVYATIAILGEAAIIFVTAEIYAERNPPGWLPSLNMGANHFCSVLGASLFIGAGIWSGAVLVILMLAASQDSAFMLFVASIGALLFAAAFIWTVSSTVAVLPVIVVENLGPLEGIKRSIELSSGRRCYFVCGTFILWLTTQIITRGLHRVFNGKDPAAYHFTPGGIIVSFLPLLLYLPLNTM
jgi:hypothetical protein